MKKQLFFIAVAGLFASTAFAADLYVRDAGAGGAYPTISAAITAAANGDRIIIRPKAAGLPYIESLTIDKSLTFVSETNFTKYVVEGRISITPSAGRTVTISNISLSDIIILTGETLGGRTTVNVMNGVMNAVSTQQPNATLNMSGCVVTTMISMSHGRITGNKCSQVVIATATVDSNPAADDIEIIANYVSTDNSGISMDQKNYAFKVLNNFLLSSGLHISRVKNGSSNEVRNNVFNAGLSSAVLIDLPAGNNGLVSVLNNVLNTTSSQSIYAEVANTGASLASVYAFYNMSSGTFTTIAATSVGSNVGNASVTINLSGASGANANAGSPEDDYADIDLTRNDIGTYGGSDSWENYWPNAVGNKPQVNYLLTPRRIYTGTTEMNAAGSGYSK